MRKIIHIDMDCFYAAVEMRDNPEYREVPIAVGGNSQRGVLCTCNYLAREYGVRSAMPVAQAKQLCPDLIILPGRMQVYKDVSAQIRQIFNKYTDLVEPLSLDEAYLDVTESQYCKGSASLMAQSIRNEIFQVTGLTASAGVAPNKFLAKIASDENKPNGQCVVAPSDVDSFVADLPLNKIPGVGPKTFARLKQVGFSTCRDVRASSVATLQLVVGKQALSLYQKSFGKDERLVETSRVRKSVGVETTFAQDLIQQEDCLMKIDSLVTTLKERFERLHNYRITKLGVKLKFNDFNTTTVEQQGYQIDAAIFKQLLIKALGRADNRSIRLIGLSLGLGQEKEMLQVKESQLALPF